MCGLGLPDSRPTGANPAYQTSLENPLMVNAINALWFTQHLTVCGRVPLAFFIE